jgi:hypothetical protein
MVELRLIEIKIEMDLDGEIYNETILQSASVIYKNNKCRI